MTYTLDLAAAGLSFKKFSQFVTVAVASPTIRENYQNIYISGVEHYVGTLVNQRFLEIHEEFIVSFLDQFKNSAEVLPMIITNLYHCDEYDIEDTSEGDTDV